VKVALPDDSTRHVNGFDDTVCRVAAAYGRYRPYIRGRPPWLWFMTRTGRLPHLSALNVPELVKKVLRRRATADFNSR